MCYILICLKTCYFIQKILHILKHKVLLTQNNNLLILAFINEKNINYYKLKHDDSMARNI